MVFPKTSRMVISIAALVLFALPGPAPADEAVVVVNGETIIQEQVDRELAGHQQRIIRSGRLLTPEMVAGLREQVIEHMVDRTLLHQASIRDGVVVSDAEVKEAFSEIRRQFVSEDAFNSALGQMNITEKGFMDELRGSIAVNKHVTERFGKNAEISKEEARAYYDTHPEAFESPEQVRARHILILSGPDAGDKEDEHMKKIQEIRQEVEAGKDFAELAGIHSQCPSREQGGDLGYFTRGKMVKPFEDAAFALGPGEVSEVVKTQFGYHIIKVEDRQAGGKAPFEEVEDNLRMYLGREAFNEAVGDYVRQLRHDAVIQRPGMDG